jgi:hypothetical protein
MISSIVVFVLAFAALGLLLGYAAAFDTQPQHQQEVKTNVNSNGTAAITLQDQAKAQVQSTQG